MASFEDYLFKELIFLDVEEQSDEDVLRFIADKLFKAGFVRESFSDAIVNRESYAPTGLNTEGIQVAIPHTDPEHVLKPCLAIATLKKPVTFKEMGTEDQTVDASIVICMALASGGEHLEILQKLIGYVIEPANVISLFNARTPDAVFDVLNR